ncbi:uncharacterized protein LOC108624535 [Ceratina calcarata]|uniref:Uncharacterized protein LOC108624535 n=1 Tax=Ceratina calcarata TaxID=156304 RepID=A0AAJ7IY21_9HYME|nr:uncharacterized protein LOC108624535 [Ceratina calcarata]
MVQFMYCGETRIPHQLLSPVLTATKKTFKVKELTTMVDAMMTSRLNAGNLKAIKNMDKEVLESKITDYMYVECNKLLKDDKCFCNEDDGDSNISSSNSNDVKSSENISLEYNASSDPANEESEHMPYVEESQDSESNVEETNALFSIANSAAERSRDSSQLVGQNVGSKNVPTTTTNGCSKINNKTPCNTNNDDSKSVLYEQCCDLSDVDETCDESSDMSLSAESCLKQMERDFARYKFEGTDVPSSKLGKFVKVYTHKRRKSIDEIKTKLTDVNVNVIHSPLSTDCIDLLDEPSTDTDIPVTLLTSLDIESAEYIISLSTENIQSIVGATLTREPREPCMVNTHKKLKIIENVTNEESKEEEEEEEEESRRTTTKNTETSNCTKPILRRSSRLNQQEVETIVNNNETDPSEKSNIKKSNSSNTSTETELCIKKKRNKIKDADRKVPEQQQQQQQAKKPLNHPRKNSKLIVKKNKCTKEKNEQAIREENKFKYDTSENNSIFVSPKLNTIEHISRALWGDMSDFSEDCNIHFLEYNTPNTEIPFAVGLLPLRTALEKMQATPDYQPRKTRSSVAIAAPVRQQQDIVGSFKKRRLNSYIGDTKENAKAVCHIQIRTAPSQYVRNRKKYLPTDINNTLESPIIMNKH